MNLKKSNKIIVFDKFSKSEINDKFNISEDKIKILPGFFYEIDKTKEEKLINFKVKYNIKGDYYIYSSGIGNQKNLDKLIEIFSHFKKENKNINLLILDEETVKNIDFRKQVIDKKLINNVFFIGNTNSIEKDYFYNNSLGEIFPFLYSSFPFYLNTALNYNNNIFCSNLKIIESIFQNNITYFNPNNTSDIIKKLQEQKTNNNHKDILNKYNIALTIKDLKNIIK